MIREGTDGVAFDVLVLPRASRERVGPVLGDRLKVAVAAPPVDGQANAALVRCLARVLGVPRSAVVVLRGRGSRRKTVQVAGVGPDAVRRLLG